MTSRRSQFALALAVCSFLLIAGCHRGEGGAHQLGTTTVTLSVDNNKNCVQSQGGIPVTNATVYYDQSVSWCAVDQAGNKLALDLQFPAGGSPFGQTTQFTATAGNCTSPSGNPANAVEKVYPYQQITIDGKQCGVGQDGVRVKGL